MSDLPIRAWYRWHWLTWLVVIVEACVLTYCQIAPHYDGKWAELGDFVRLDFGWPAVWMEGIQSGTVVGIAPDFRHYRYPASAPLLVADVAIGLLLVVSCGVVVESWMRKTRRTQLSLQGLLAFTAVTSIMLFIVANPRAIDSFFGWDVNFHRSWFAFPAGAGWPLKTVILVGVGCAIYVIGALATRTLLSIRTLVVRSKE